jgi:Predicted membrane protein
LQNQTIFYNHASPILFLVYPLYLMYPSIPTLMTIQTALATLPALPLYKLGLRLFEDRRYALLTALAYLLFPWITTYLVGPFEVVILTAPFFALALYSLYMGNRLGYWLSLTLMMTTIEFAPLLGIFIGLYILVTKLDWLKARGRVALGIETLAFSLAWLFGDFLLVYYFSRGAINIFQNVWGSALSGPLISITDSIGNVIFHFTTHTGPSSSHQAALSLSSVLESLVNNVRVGLHTKVQSTIFLMLPTLFLNLAEPQNLLLLPWLYVMWQTPWSFYYVVWAYYTALAAPAVIVPAIWALRKFRPRVRRALMVALFIAVTISTLLLNGLSPLSALYFHEPLPNPLQPATTPYDLALIQLNDYVPPNESVSVPASAVPWFSSTRYGWNEHGVPFFGPNNYTKYEVYSPFVPTGYPYDPNFNNYLPYVFNDGAWLLIGPFQRPYSFNYTTTVTLLPLTPGQHQYSVTTMPGGGPVTVSLNVSYTLLQTIEYLTKNLSWVLQQPQGIACGTLPGYFAPLNGSEYLVQPITINETTTIEALTVFGSGSYNLVHGEVMISSSEVPTLKHDVLWSASFWEPWWCSPHGWATPITVNPMITLRPGTYYVVLNMPTNPWQTVCTYIPGAPKALLYNGSALVKQLNCTLNLIMITNRPAEVANANASVSISLIIQNSTAVALNKTVTLVAQRPLKLPLTYWANLTGSSYQEALVVTVNQSSGLPSPGELSVTISDYMPADSPPIPLIKLYSLNYTATEALSPITPGSHQYSLALLPEGPVKVGLSVNYTPLQAIEYLTSNLSWLLQLPQQPPSGICGTVPGYFALLNGSEYLVQPVTVNETATIESLVVFGSVLATW